MTTTWFSEELAATTIEDKVFALLYAASLLAIISAALAIML